MAAQAKDGKGRRQSVIQTERLALVPLTMAYLESTHRYASDAEHARYMMFLPNDSIAQTEAFIRTAEAERAKDAPAYWEFAILLDGVHIGGASLFRLDDPQGAELGWILDRHFEGHGYATEAARGVMAWGREKMGFTRFIAQCDAENAASARVMERLGMRLIERCGGRKNRSSEEEREELTYEIRF